MSRAARIHPTKQQLQTMPVLELEKYIRMLTAELEWRDGGPVKKFVTKRLQVATKILEARSVDG